MSSDLQPPETQILGTSRYWGTGCMDCLLLYFHKKKTNQIRSRDEGVHCWPACLSLYCRGKLLLRNSVTLIKIGTLDHFVWRRKWYCPLFQSAASSILRSHHACNCLFCDREGLVTRYGSEHIYLWAFSGMLCCWIRSFQASLLTATWDNKSLLTEILFIISVQNVGCWTPLCDLICWKICDL